MRSLASTIPSLQTSDDHLADLADAAVQMPIPSEGMERPAEVVTQGDGGEQGYPPLHLRYSTVPPSSAQGTHSARAVGRAITAEVQPLQNTRRRHTDPRLQSCR